MLKNLMLVSLLNIGKLLLQSSIAIVIALFTTPERFGLIGFALPLVTFLILIGTAGIAPAIIRQPDLGSRELGAALSMAFAISVFLSVVIAIAAPFLERGARLPGLSGILCVLGIVIIPANLAETLRAALERQLRYQPLVKVELTALGVAVGTAILGAMAGAGIWALVLYHLVLQVARATGMALLQRAQIRLNFDWSTIRPMLLFGGLTLVANLCNFASRNIDNLLIGANFGSRALGLYGIAYQLMTLPLIAIAWPASNLLLATLKRLTPGDAIEYADTVRDMLTFTAAIAFPIAAWLSIAFPWAAGQLLPARWRDVAPLLALLAPAGALQSLAAFTGAVLLSREKARMNLAISLASAAIQIGGFVVGVRLGFRGFVVIYIALSSIVSIGQLGLLAHVAGMTKRSLIRQLAPALLGAALLGLGFLMLRSIGENWPRWIGMNALALIAIASLYVRWYPHLLGHTLVKFLAARSQAAVG